MTTSPNTDLVQVLAEHAPELLRIGEGVAGTAAKGYRGRMASRGVLKGLERQLEAFEKACKMIEASRLPFKALSAKALFPLLDALEVEENPDLRNGWSALIANAATSGESSTVTFSDVLRQLEPLQAKILDDVYATITTVAPELRNSVGVRREDIQARHGLSVEDFHVLADTLIRNRLVVAPRTWGGMENEYASLTITPFGTRFVQACRPPGTVDPAPTILTRAQLDAMVKRQADLPAGAVPDEGSYFPDRIVPPDAVTNSNSAEIDDLGSRLDELEMERDLQEQEAANDARGI